MLKEEITVAAREDSSSRLSWLCLLLGLFSVICGAKLWLVHYFGNATPFWDEWDIEAPLIIGYFHGTLSPAQFFAPHNEHRIAFTRALVMLLFRANQLQWDPVLQMVAQVPLHALSITVFVSRAGKCMSGRGRVALAAFAACLSMVPFGWDNTLQGESAEFHLSITFGVLVIWLCWNHRALSLRWWLGALLAFANLFTMASGVFAIIAVTAFLTVRLFVEWETERNRRMAAIMILAAIAAFGLAITPKGLHPELMAHNIREFLWALTGLLSWPCGFHWGFCIIQAPLIALALLCVYRRVPFTDGRWFPLIIGSVFWLESGATAYKRFDGWDASRYCDFWAMLLIAGCVSLYYLWDAFGPRRQRLIYPAAAVWLLACATGLLDMSVNQLPSALIRKRETMMEMENNLREYLRTGDKDYLKGQIPYPKADVLEDRLSSDVLRSALPSVLINPNPPLAIVAQNNMGDGFTVNACPPGIAALGETYYGSYGRSGARSQGSTALTFAIPSGTREVELRVAGYPSTPGMPLLVKEPRIADYSIAPPIDPGLLWETVTFHLKTKASTLKIRAKDNSDWAWLAFSAPKVSNRHALGRWADSVAAGFMGIFALGLVLMVTGALLAARPVVQPQSVLPATAQ